MGLPGYLTAEHYHYGEKTENTMGENLPLYYFSGGSIWGMELLDDEWKAVSH